MTFTFTKAKLLLPLWVFFVFYAFRNSDNKTPSVFNAENITARTAVMPPPVSCTTPTNNVEKVVCLANDFKATLTATQIATLQIAFTTTTQVRWSNLPCGVSCRNGLEFSTLSAAQLTAAKAVIAAAAGTATDEGYAEFSQINLADTYLSQSAGSGYGEGKYIIAFLGTPSTTGKWMLQFGGHHYAQNITYNAGAVVSTTPSHQGIEPLTYTNSLGTFSPLKAEQAGMLAMLGSLTTAQLATAKLSTSFSDVLLGPGKDGQFPATKLGLACRELTAAQKASVIAAMKPWTADADNASGALAQALYERELDATYIAYANNPTLAANTDYVRIDGPSVWIELVCQNGVVFSGIHYHCIYRDHTRDYGAGVPITGVKEWHWDSNSAFTIGKSYPNPFSTITTIPFTLNEAATVKVSILDIFGRELAVVANGKMDAGVQNILFNRQASATNLPTGSYICKINVTNSSGTYTDSNLLMIQ